MPYSRICCFDVNPCSFSTSTSTHSPWQSNPFWYRSSSPFMAWYRWKASLSVRPQAWWTPMGLLAVMGPSRNDHFLPPLLRDRNLLNMSADFQKSSTSCSFLTISIQVSTFLNWACFLDIVPRWVKNQITAGRSAPRLARLRKTGREQSGGTLPALGWKIKDSCTTHRAWRGI